MCQNQIYGMQWKTLKGVELYNEIHICKQTYAMYIQSKATTIYHNLGHCIVAASVKIVVTRATVIAKVDTSEIPDFSVYLWKYYNGVV